MNFAHHTSDDVVRSRLEAIRSAWGTVSELVASHPELFRATRDKELAVKKAFCNKLRDDLSDAHVLLSEPGSQIKFGPKEVDLTVAYDDNVRVAIEAKFKVKSDGAYPDNRTAAWDDLDKLRQYTQGNEYSHGLFVWLTDRPDYYSRDVSAKSVNSTHHGRQYQAGTLLKLARARDRKPREWLFPWGLDFLWHQCAANPDWRWLVIQIPPEVQ